MVDEALNQPLALLAVMCVVLLGSTFLAAHTRRRWRPLTDEEHELVQLIVGATLTLLALIVGFSFSMAISRFDQRKNYEEAEANAIATEFLRVELLPAPASDRAGRLLRDYLDLRIAFYRELRKAELDRIGIQTSALERQLWSTVRAAAAEQPSAMATLVVVGLNNVLDSQGSSQAAWWNRIPEGAWALMTAIAMCCCALIGYGARAARRSLLIVLPVILSVALSLIADIDSPRTGLIRVQPRNLIGLSQAQNGRR
jgi:hypothetical protein